MKIEEVLNKYRSRLKKEAIIKSIAFGFLIGLSALAISAFIVWMTGYKAFWISFVVFAVVSAAAIALFYFLKFKPTDGYVARRVDALGMEERMVTMMEFRGESDGIYELQREDTVSVSSGFSATMLKLSLPLALLIILPVLFVLSAGTTTLSVLSSGGVIRSGGKIINEVINEVEEERNKRYYEVTYLVEGNGFIEEEEFQVVESGKNGNPVIAVAEDDWAFVMWSDGVEDPVRVEMNVRENITISAIFAPANGESPFQGNGDKDKEGDQDSGRPGENGKPGPEGEGGDEESEATSDNPGGNAGGGKYDPANQIIDGQTYYGGDLYQEYYESVNEALSEDATIGKEEKEYIENYFKIIAE